MKLSLRSMMVWFMAFALASCSPPEIKIAVREVNGRFLVGLTQDWGIIFSDKKVPCVDRIDLRTSDLSAHDRSVWRVEARTDQCVKISSFVVGIVPPGFKKVTDEPSISHKFTLSVSGVGSGSIELVFS